MVRLSGSTVVALSAGELLSGLLKSSGFNGRLGIEWIIYGVFAAAEFVLACILVASVFSGVGSLEFELSKACYASAVVIHLMAVLVDIVTAGLFLIRAAVRVRRNIFAALWAVCAISFLSLVGIGFVLALFQRLEWDLNNIAVTDLASDTSISLGARLCVTGLLFSSLFLITAFLSFVYLQISSKISLYHVVFYVISLSLVLVGGTLISIAGLFGERQAANGYAYVAVSTLPSLVSGAFASVKFVSYYQAIFS